MSDTRLDPAAVPELQTGPTDEELLAGLAAGRLEALDALYERYKTMAYGIARRVTGDDVLAQDVVQDAFIGAWRSADRYMPGRGSVRTWLLSIVHHRAIDAVRRRRPVSELPTPESGQPTPAALTLPDVWGEVAGRLDRATVSRRRRHPAGVPARGRGARLLGRPDADRDRRPARACRWAPSRAGSGSRSSPSAGSSCPIVAEGPP